MDAEQARRLTKESLTGYAIQPLLMTAYGRIEQAAKAGKSEVAHPFYGHQSEDAVVTTVHFKAALRQLEDDGFTVTHHPKPQGINDPRETAYDTVSW